MSSPEVTITLGRSRQVVKRKRADLEGAQTLSYQSSIRDRSASYVDTKRQRDIAVKVGLGLNGENDVLLEKNDLRYKLIRGRLPSESCTAASANECREELRGELSGAPARSSMSSNRLQHDPQSHGIRHFLSGPSRETARDLPYVDCSENYSTFTRDDLRWRSLARSLEISSGWSPTYKTEMQKAATMRLIDPSGVHHAYSNPIPEPSRSAVPAQMMTPIMSKVAGPSTLFPSPSGIIPGSSFMAEAPVTVTGLLNSLGLGKYAIHFQAEEVDMTALKQMGEEDLKDLGIPMGPRKKILHALSAPCKRQLFRQL